MFPLLPIAAASHWTEIQLLYAIPLVIAISFVYGATRHENIGPIIDNSFRALIWILGFMGMIFVVLWFISRSL